MPPGVCSWAGVADTDPPVAIFSHRPYKPARPLLTALDTISTDRAGLLAVTGHVLLTVDTDVVDACLATSTRT